MLEKSPEFSWALAESRTDAKFARAALSAAATKNLENLSNTVKVHALLDNAKTLSNYAPKLTYGLWSGQFVCDTFIKYLFSQAGDESLKWLYWAPSLYTHFNPSKENTITSTSRYAFNTAEKYPSAGDLLFFTDANGTCWHVAMLSRVDATGNMYVYDATPTKGVSERKLRPNELIAPSAYKNIYYTSPIKNQTA